MHGPHLYLKLPVKYQCAGLADEQPDKETCFSMGDLVPSVHLGRGRLSHQNVAAQFNDFLKSLIGVV